MLFKSQVFSQASGSVGGLTYSRNRGGMYTRARAVPTNPNSDRQVVVRQSLGILSQGWSSLTEPQRQGWNQYAANVAMVNKLGDSVFLTGQQHYIRSNVSRLQAGLAIIAAPPVTYNLGSFTAPSAVVVDTTTDEWQANITNTDEWAITTGGALLLYQGREQNAGRSFYKGPFQFMAAILGNTADPPDVAQVIPLVQLVEPGNKTWIGIRASQPDGRLSPLTIFGPYIAEA